MMGKQTEQSPLFYYINIGDMIPGNHILRLIDKYIDFSFIRKRAKHLYSSTGRPSVDPEVLIKMLLMGYLYGISSERRLCEEVNLNIAYRWFIGLSLDDKVPDHSTFSKNRHNRFKESGIFQDIFDEIVKRCIDKGFVSAAHLSVDGSLIKANASIGSMEPIVVRMNPGEYMNSVEIENQQEIEDNNNDKRTPADTDGSHLNSTDKSSNPSFTNQKKNADTYKEQTSKFKGKKISNKTYRSKTDPDARGKKVIYGNKAITS